MVVITIIYNTMLHVFTSSVKFVYKVARKCEHWCMGRKPLIIGETTKRVVQVLREHMEDQGVSGRELARLADMGATRCRDLLAGERPILVDELEAMSDALGLVGWKVLREAETSLPGALPTIDPETLGLAANDDERDRDMD